MFASALPLPPDARKAMRPGLLAWFALMTLSSRSVSAASASTSQDDSAGGSGDALDEAIAASSIQNAMLDDALQSTVPDDSEEYVDVDAAAAAAAAYTDPNRALVGRGWSRRAACGFRGAFAA